jgi:hypothetical protein
MDMDEFAAAIRARRAAAGLNVRLDRGEVLSFATETNRDEFTARAEHLGRKVEMPQGRNREMKSLAHA